MLSIQMLWLLPWPRSDLLVPKTGAQIDQLGRVTRFLVSLFFCILFYYFTEYIIFRGTDICDLNVCDLPTDRFPQDPAILSATPVRPNDVSLDLIPPLTLARWPKSSPH